MQTLSISEKQNTVKDRNGFIFDMQKIKKGVPQGSVLGLFLIIVLATKAFRTVFKDSIFGNFGNRMFYLKLILTVYDLKITI